MNGLPLLSIAILLPVIGAVLLLFVSNRDGAKNGLVNNLALRHHGDACYLRIA